MTVTLRNSKGKIIFSSTKEAACFVSVKRCANKASDKIINQIEEMSGNTQKINEMGNMLADISALMERSISEMGKQVDQFEAYRAAALKTM